MMQKSRFLAHQNYGALRAKALIINAYSLDPETIASEVQAWAELPLPAAVSAYACLAKALRKRGRAYV